MGSHPAALGGFIRLLWDAGTRTTVLLRHARRAPDLRALSGPLIPLIIFRPRNLGRLGAAGGGGESERAVAPGSAHARWPRSGAAAGGSLGLPLPPAPPTAFSARAAGRAAWPEARARRHAGPGRRKPRPRGWRAGGERAAPPRRPPHQQWRLPPPPRPAAPARLGAPEGSRTGQRRRVGEGSRAEPSQTRSRGRPRLPPSRPPRPSLLLLLLRASERAPSGPAPAAARTTRRSLPSSLRSPVDAIFSPAFLLVLSTSVSLARLLRAALRRRAPSPHSRALPSGSGGGGGACAGRDFRRAPRLASPPPPAAPRRGSDLFSREFRGERPAGGVKGSPGLAGREGARERPQGPSPKRPPCRETEAGAGTGRGSGPGTSAD